MTEHTYMWYGDKNSPNTHCLYIKLALWNIICTANISWAMNERVHHNMSKCWMQPNTSLSQLGCQIPEERNRKGIERDQLQQWHRWFFFFFNQHFITVIYAISTSQNMVCYGWKVSLLNLWISKELVLRTVKEEQSVCKLLYWASWGLRWLGGFETVRNS